MFRREVKACLVVLLVLAWGLTEAGVTVLQQGASPTKEYAGCTDTVITSGRWSRGRDSGRSASLSASRGGRILIRFDLSPIPKGDAIHRAVLRLTDTSYPRKGRDGKFWTGLEAYPMTREWKDNANWLEHTRTNYRKKDEGDWAKEGGEFKDAMNYVKAHTVADGPWGHVHELDITQLVTLWHAGKLPNHGMMLKTDAKSRGGCSVASADWPIAAYGPKLIVDHGAKPTGIPALTPVAKDVELDPIAKTPDAGKAQGEYAAVRVGQNANCALRGKSTDTYVKDNAETYPGNWGWMTFCRAGGVAGDVNRALLYFDLSGIPKTASIKSAKLVCSLGTRTSRTIRQYRNGVFLVKGLAKAPGWVDSEVVSAERKAGTPWPAGELAGLKAAGLSTPGAVAASSDKPLSLGVVTQKEVVYRKRKQKIDAGIEFDLTARVRAWVQGKVPNCGVVLDNRIEGGVYDIYSSRAFRPELRPYLEVEVSPAIKKKPEPIKVALAPPPGDYWVEPMKKVHARFKGKAGTLAQYGDSITVTMAYLASYGWGGKITAKNMTPEVRKEADLVQSYGDLKLWRKWKGSGWGNTGVMKSDWLFRNIDRWQKKMNPETSTIMFGTNDRGGIVPPQYTEYMAASIRRMMQDGTVPMLNSIPPPGAHDYWLAALSIAHGLKVPLIDYYAEVMRRRPDDYNGRLKKFDEGGWKGYNVPTLISRDGCHPSNPSKYVNDWSNEALNCSGYGLRNYMTVRMYAQAISKVYLPAKAAKEAK